MNPDLIDGVDQEVSGAFGERLKKIIMGEVTIVE